MMTRAKRILKASLKSEIETNRKRARRISPKENAAWWIEAGLDQDGFRLKYINDFKGFGVYTTQKFSQGGFLLEYVGETIDTEEAIRREKRYSSKRCFLYYYKIERKGKCIDATKTQGRMGNMVNDAPAKDSNCVMKMQKHKGSVKLCLFANRDIEIDEELVYDYGDSKGNLWWRNKECQQETDGEDSDYDPDPFGLNLENEIGEDGNVGKMSPAASANEDSDHNGYGTDDIGREQPKTSLIVVPNSDHGHIGTSDFNMDEDFASDSSGEDEEEEKESRIMPDIANLLSKIGEERNVGKMSPAASANEDCYQNVHVTDDIGREQPKTSLIVVPNSDHGHIGTSDFNMDEDFASDSSGEDEEEEKERRIMPDIANLLSRLDRNVTGDFNLEAITRCHTLALPAKGAHECDSQAACTTEDFMQHANITKRPILETEKDQCDIDSSEMEDNSDIDPDYVIEGSSSNSSFQDCNKSDNITSPVKETANSSSSTSVCTEVNPEVQHHVGNSEMQDRENKKAEIYKKPSRKCPFCGLFFQEKLSRHITLKHKDIEAVSKALSLPKKEKLVAFSKFRKDGILKANKELIKDGEKDSALQRERKQKTKGETVMCGMCNGFFSKTFYGRHKRRCSGDSSNTPASIPVSLLEKGYEIIPQGFKMEILGRFKSDEIGAICRSDPTILLIGQRLWHKLSKKPDKLAEVRKSVMTDMRRLSCLFLEFQKARHEMGVQVNPNSNTSSDMFSRKNFKILELAIESYSSAEDGTIKPGLKQALYYLLKNATKIIKASFLIEDQDKEADEMDRFKAVLELNHNFIFGDATYEINKGRQKKLRKPQQLPLEEDVQTIRQFAINTIKELIGDAFLNWGEHEFVSLRDAAVSRLTLFNARRGGEPCRLLLSEWQDAENEVWIDKSRIQHIQDPVEKQLASSLKVTYQSGKGNNHLVPVLIPEDTLPAIRKLADPETRQLAGVKPDNQYIFASTQASDNHVSGWHANNNIAKLANIKNVQALTATKMRHRVSTLYALLEMPPAQREAFYKHMGHSEEINKNVYQAPLALLEITKVGKQLHRFDTGQTGQFDNAETSVESLNQDKSVDYEHGARSSDVQISDQTLAFEGNGATDIGERGPQNQTLGSELTKNASRKATGRGYFKWKAEDTRTVIRHFKDILDEEGCANKGSLPGKAEIVNFLEKYPRILSDKDLSEKIRLMRTKLFNQRKTVRMSLKTRIKNLKH